MLYGRGVLFSAVLISLFTIAMTPRLAVASNNCANENGVCEPGLGEDYVNCAVNESGDCSHADGVCDARERTDGSSPAECELIAAAPAVSAGGMVVAVAVLLGIGVTSFSRRRSGVPE